VGVENALRISIEQVFAGFQPLSGFGGQPTTVKIQLLYLFQPALAKEQGAKPHRFAELMLPR
jgi:hypothetical protein